VNRNEARIQGGVDGKPVINPEKGVRAVVKSKSIEPESVERYWESKFGMLCR
jgi:hypothetical protein